MGVRNAILDFRQQEENHIMENVIYLDGNSLTVDQVVEICRHGAKVALSVEW